MSLINKMPVSVQKMTYSVTNHLGIQPFCYGSLENYIHACEKKEISEILIMFETTSPNCGCGAYSNEEYYHLMLTDTNDELSKYYVKTIGPTYISLTKREAKIRKVSLSLAELENEFELILKKYENYTPKVSRSEKLIKFLDEQTK